MKKLFIFIFFSLIFFGGGVATAQEKNNLCPNVDLLHNVANEFTNIDLTKQPNKCNLDFKDVIVNSNTDITKLHSLIKYYYNTIQYLYSLNCFNGRSVIYIKKGIVIPDNINTEENFSLLDFSRFFINSYNFLSNYNNKLLNNGVSCIE